MVVAGGGAVVGSQATDAAILLDKARAVPDLVDLQAAREGADVTIRAAAMAVPVAAVVQLVEYAPLRVVQVARGENRGRTLDYTNVVTRWTVLGSWDGTGPLSATARLTDAEGGAAVIVQTAGQGPVLAAARLR